MDEKAAAMGAGGIQETVGGGAEEPARLDPSREVITDSSDLEQRRAGRNSSSGAGPYHHHPWGLAAFLGKQIQAATDHLSQEKETSTKAKAPRAEGN